MTPAVGGEENERVKSDPTGRRMVAVMLSDGLSRIRKAEVIAVTDPVESVHQIRVACRRTRSQLKTFGPLLRGSWSGELEADLRWLEKEYAASRDLAVGRGAVLHAADEVGPQAGPALGTPDDQKTDGQAVVAEPGPLARLDHLMTGQASSAALRAGESIDPARRRHLMKIWASSARKPKMSKLGKTGGRDAVVALVGGARERLHLVVAGLTPESPDEDWHRARILAKRLRCAAGVTPLRRNEPFHRWAKQARRMQVLLGSHQDSVVASQTLRGIPVDDSDPVLLAMTGEIESALARGRLRIRREFLREFGTG